MIDAYVANGIISRDEGDKMIQQLDDEVKKEYGSLMKILPVVYSLGENRDNPGTYCRTGKEVMWPFSWNGYGSFEEAIMNIRMIVDFPIYKRSFQYMTPKYKGDPNWDEFAPEKLDDPREYELICPKSR